MMLSHDGHARCLLGTFGHGQVDDAFGLGSTYIAAMTIKHGCQLRLLLFCAWFIQGLNICFSCFILIIRKTYCEISTGKLNVWSKIQWCNLTIEFTITVTKIVISGIMKKGHGTM